MTTYRVQLDVELEVDDMQAVQGVAHAQLMEALAERGGIEPNEFADTDQQGVDFMMQEERTAVSILVAGAMHAGAASFPGGSRLINVSFRPLPVAGS